MAKRKSSKSRSSASAGRSTRSSKRRNAKFAGTIIVRPPSGGRILPGGTRIVVSLAELSLTKIPDPGKNAELSLRIGVRSTDADGVAFGQSYAPGLFSYQRDGSRMNLLGPVIFDDVVHQHLSFDVELTEVEMGNLSGGKSAVTELLQTGVDALGKASSLSRGPAAVADAIPGLVSGLMSLNANDQVLKFATSFFTRELDRDDGMLPLKKGVYTIEKHDGPVPRGKTTTTQPWVTMKLRVSPVFTPQLQA